MTQQTLETPTQNSPETDRSAPSVPVELESAGTKLVYVYLDAAGGATIDDLRESLGMKTITLYPLLDSLEKRNVVERDGDTYLLA